MLKQTCVCLVYVKTYFISRKLISRGVLTLQDDRNWEAHPHLKTVPGQSPISVALCVSCGMVLWSHGVFLILLIPAKQRSFQNSYL